MMLSSSAATRELGSDLDRLADALGRPVGAERGWLTVVQTR